jgi:propionate CoA-transferase
VIAVVYCGTFTAGGLKVDTGDGRMRVVREGQHNKFLDHVEEITFSGAQATKRGQRVLYVTERAVFELRGGRMTLTEIAPGIDLKRDVLAQMGFEPAIASDLAAMERGIFYPRWGALRLIIESKAAGQQQRAA